MQVEDHHEAPTKLLDLVTRRYEFLTVLDTAASDKRTLENTLDISRSTVDRALRELEATDLVCRADGGYRTTLFGRTLVAIYDLLLDHFDHVSRAKTLLAELPSEIDFNIGLVVDAEICISEEPAFHEPASRVADLIEAASELRGLAYAHTSPKALELFQQQVLDAGISSEIVFRQAMYESFKTTHPDLFDTFLNADNYTAYVTSGIPFGLFLLTIEETEYVCLIVYDTDHNLKGVIVNNTAEAVAWGTRTFERYRNRATPLE